MTETKEKRFDFAGCCSGSDFRFPMSQTEMMSKMMARFCGEGGSFDCAAMMEKYRSEDGSIDCAKVMETMKEYIKK
jgi:hypothetical protein